MADALVSIGFGPESMAGWPGDPEREMDQAAGRDLATQLALIKWRTSRHTRFTMLSSHLNEEVSSGGHCSVFSKNLRFSSFKTAVTILYQYLTVCECCTLFKSIPKIYTIYKYLLYIIDTICNIWIRRILNRFKSDISYYSIVLLIGT